MSKYYCTLLKLVTITHCRFAQKTTDGWIARRTAKNATHKLHYLLIYGQVDRNMVTPEILES